MQRLQQIRRAYEAWVATNPDTVCDVETTSKWVSYFILGRVSDSTLSSELVYSLSNMLVLYHDRVIASSQQQSQSPTKAAPPTMPTLQRIKLLLTALEHFQVFFELSAQRVFGTRGKWLLVSLMQVLKSAGRYYLLRYAGEKIIVTPPIPLLNRQTVAKQQLEQAKLDADSFKFQLKRSGRLVRKVEGAPPLQYRDIEFFEPALANDGSSSLYVAECLYIAKPLLHLAAMRWVGDTRRWTPYMLALALDLVSIRIGLKQRGRLNQEQRLEVSRRCVHLLLYLMRSPFYERYTQKRLESVFGMLGTLPLVKLVSNTVRNYVPHWQRTYFHIWST